jgi:hypothetical protein
MVLFSSTEELQLSKRYLSGTPKLPDTEFGSRATRVRSKSSSPSLSDICFPADVDGGWPNGRGIDQSLSPSVSSSSPSFPLPP